MPGFKDVLKGILAYNKSLRPQMVEQFKRVRDQPKVSFVIDVNCIKLLGKFTLADFCF